MSVALGLALLPALLQDPGAAILGPCPSLGEGVLCGTVEVYEDREAGEGLRLGLDVVVLQATGEDPSDEPLFVLAGGPGVAATRQAQRWVEDPLRIDRDVVLVDQRGTAGNHLLACAPPADLQGYLDPLFDVEGVRACRDALAETYDLTLYGTPTAMDDLDDVRAALGYEQVHLLGGSYGTRAALVWLRRHPESVRTVTLNGVSPLSFTNPLFHAEAAQQGLDLLLAECEADPACGAAFPDLRAELAAVFARLSEAPVEVELTDATSGEPVPLTLDRDAFAEALRVMTYYLATNREVPLLVHRAFEGDYAPFARTGLLSNRAIRDLVPLGMLLCVTCTEDVARIDPDEVDARTAATYLGDVRVRAQRAACAEWPPSRVADDLDAFGAPVVSEVPALILSGTLDPVTPPRWGEEAARHLSSSLHLVVPGAHGVRGPCVDGILREFLRAASTAELDTACVESIRLPPFSLPD